MIISDHHACCNDEKVRIGGDIDLPEQHFQTVRTENNKVFLSSLIIHSYPQSCPDSDSLSFSIILYNGTPIRRTTVSSSIVSICMGWRSHKRSTSLSSFSFDEVIRKRSYSHHHSRMLFEKVLLW